MHAPVLTRVAIFLARVLIFLPRVLIIQPRVLIILAYLIRVHLEMYINKLLCVQYYVCTSIHGNAFQFESRQSNQLYFKQHSPGGDTVVDPVCDWFYSGLTSPVGGRYIVRLYVFATRQSKSCLELDIECSELDMTTERSLSLSLCVCEVCVCVCVCV